MEEVKERLLLCFPEGGEMKRFFFRPQHDITAYELAQVMRIIVLISVLGEEIAPVWKKAGPVVWRHFEPGDDHG